MNREEITNSQDYKATKIALDWWYSLPEEQRKATDIDAEPDIVDAYSDGVLYGWNNPNWISVEDYEKDELPSLMDKEDQYGCSVSALFVVNLDGVQYINKGCFDYDTGVWHSLDTCMSYTKEQVTHWMPLPQPPRKED